MGTQPCLFVHLWSVSVFPTPAELNSCNRECMFSQTEKYLLPGLLQKKFVTLWSKMHSTGKLLPLSIKMQVYSPSAGPNSVPHSVTVSTSCYPGSLPAFGPKWQLMLSDNTLVIGHDFKLLKKSEILFKFHGTSIWKINPHFNANSNTFIPDCWITESLLRREM